MKSDSSSRKSNNTSKYNRLRTISRLRIFIIVVFLNVIFAPVFTKFEAQKLNRFTILVNGVEVGVTDNANNIYDYYREARAMIASTSENMVFVEFPDITYTAEAVIYGDIDDDQTIINNMYNILASNKVETLSHVYMIKVGDETYTVDSSEDVLKFFEDAISEYDVNDVFSVELAFDATRELSVLKANIIKTEREILVDDELVVAESHDEDTRVFVSAGYEDDFYFDMEDLEEDTREGFDAFDYGIESIDFSQNIEIVEAYLPEEQIMDIAYVEDVLLHEQEVQQIYKVKPGDTLSGISIEVGLPLDEIIALNSSLENEYSIINIDQELIITVPEPSLSVIWTEQAKLEEAYNLPTVYIYNDTWFTTDSVTRQQPSAGYHEAVLRITHENDTVTSKETIYEVVIKEPVAKVIEVGTIVPPTYIKPIAGGRLSSTFGGRASPGGIGSTNHKGVDWATPVGTSVYASCGGTVISAGWRGGYGYCIDIQHPDGKVTRYAHLSKIYVYAGQYVSQGEVIALSGNTGNSTGPHIHFEIIVNGVQVNPFNYL